MRPDMHFNDLYGPGAVGAVPARYYTRATITATVYSSPAANAEEKAKAAYKIIVCYKFGTTWYSTTLAIPEGKTTASTTVSAVGTSSYPVYYGISKNTSSEAVIAGKVISDKDKISPLKYTVYYKKTGISYTPKITANGVLTVNSNIAANEAHKVEDSIAAKATLMVNGNIAANGALDVASNITAKGNVYGYAFYANSDRELKTNIENIYKNTY